jgi:hypothetical protein
MGSLNIFSRERIEYIENKWVFSDLGESFPAAIQPSSTTDLDKWGDDIIAQLFELSRVELNTSFSSAIRMLQATVAACREHTETRYDANTRWVTLGDLREVTEKACARANYTARIRASRNPHTDFAFALGSPHSDQQDELSIQQRGESHFLGI